MTSLQVQHIEITNPRICEFYNNHKCFDVETMNLFIIDFLEKSVLVSSTQTPITFSTSPIHFQISELQSSFSFLQDAIIYINKSLLTTFLQYKSEYISEFKSIFDNQLKSNFTNNNTIFIQKIQNLLYAHIPESVFKSKYHTLHEKITNTIKQFQQIINANVDTLFNKPNSTIYDSFISNFEINSSHLIQSIQQHFTEFLQSKHESINKLSTEISQKFNPQTYTQYSKLNYELNDFIHNLKKYNTNSVCQFETLVSQLYPTSTITTHNTSSMNTLLTLYRDNKESITISSIANKDRNINIDEVKEFNKTVLENNTHGIFISQYTGITSKPNFHVDIQNKHIVVYIHNALFSPDKIQIAVDMIETIYSKLYDFISSDNKLAIPKDVLDDINREYQSFITQKESAIELVKEFNKKLISQLNEITFPSLDKFLATRYSTHKKQGYICDICNQFTVPTLKGLAAHKRGCNRKHTNQPCDKKSNTPPVL